MSQLDELIDHYGRDKHCLAAAEKDLRELIDHKVKVEEQIAYAERNVRHWVNRADASYSAIRHRIDAQTDSPINTVTDEMVADRIWGPSQDK